jgi:hypothetical protein
MNSVLATRRYHACILGRMYLLIDATSAVWAVLYAQSDDEGGFFTGTSLGFWVNGSKSYIHRQVQFVPLPFIVDQI